MFKYIISRALFAFTEDPFYVSNCVLGLSGPLFALKALCLIETDSIWRPLVLFELFETFILLEETNLVWHLAGILTGIGLMMTFGRANR